MDYSIYHNKNQELDIDTLKFIREMLVSAREDILINNDFGRSDEINYDKLSAAWRTIDEVVLKISELEGEQDETD